MVLFDYVEKWDGILYGLYNIIAKLKYLLLDNKTKALLKRSLSIKDSNKGKRCFIVLNGPSISNYDLTKLKNEYVFSCNYFYKSKLAEIVKPNVFCWLDSKDISTEKGDFIIHEIQSKFPNSILIFNIKALKKEIEHLNNIYFTYNKHLPYKGHIKNDLNTICSGFKTVAFYAINAAIYMGFSEIYILGLDFEPTGFSHYEDIPGEMKKLNTLNNRHAICDHYWGYAQQHMEAYAISDFAKEKGVNIINVNNNSYIRAFEFCKYESIFNK